MRSLVVRLAILVVALPAAACLASECPPIAGSPADVRTVPGSHAGYEVVAGTDDSVLAVVGTGTVALVDGPAICAAVSELGGLLSSVPSWSAAGGTALGCEGATSWWFAFADYRDIDQAVELTGSWLRDHDYTFRIELEVASFVCLN